ncbi:bifunctional (p)ppGpp synthetase/guanosine-3',5'-bis(diphosphate) 3'-pyrophosphohydrolase [Nitrosomonas sp.]|uniref:RelA/SpoT family protein n=1 Tax=Nitrosomonas sp. TaxID=42353 RepID=UPI0020872369|nr:bifunctional (p)ppGpp synthetase/guanosine-3',5'-bis(diphosphate) 3'-pyrophosphohydrolase [Nitrosomonas sp.]GJL75125.1 MAG: GTP pyrophosphokinase [Nitrosomonas sp.]
MITSTHASCASNMEIASWLESVATRLSPSDNAVLKNALDYVLQRYDGQRLSSGEQVTRHMLGTVTILASLRVDTDTLVAGILHAIPDYLDDYANQLQNDFNPTVVHLVDGVARMGRIKVLGFKNDAARHNTQVETLRKMLLAMAEDIRVVIITLASRAQTMRYVVSTDVPERMDIAYETMDVFAPLANRLGLWQVKWELEDLSFRILEPARYKKIARLLEETRVSREQYIASVVTELQHALQLAGIRVAVNGRPKHIYSIHKKMKRKDLDFSEIYDARAVRILVDDVTDCYAALGIVHSMWAPIPKEFDDYIAKPKSNGYRSLHTAVTGPEDKVVEIQIRTHEMHRHSELGVAAHWRYKEGSTRDARYEEKITWLRQILEWKNDVSDAGELAEQFKIALFEDSVYVLTPQGNVIALPKDATPLDFAYHVHTDLGHRCRGAKVDGMMVPLDYQLQNAQKVEIMPAKAGGPSRDWLNEALGYLKSARARSKVRQWFNHQALKATLAQGRAIVEKLLQRHGATAISLDKLAAQFNFSGPNNFFIAVAKSEISQRQLETVLAGRIAPAAAQPDAFIDKKAPMRPMARQTGGEILINGVGGLLSVLAKCCKPVPPDPIVGFVTRHGRGISIHRRNCLNIPQLLRKNADRMVEADWGVVTDKAFQVDVEIKAHERQWLLRDVSEILSREKVNAVAMNTESRRGMTNIQLTLEVNETKQLNRVLALLKELSGVTVAGRKNR